MMKRSIYYLIGLLAGMALWSCSDDALYDLSLIHI